MTLQSDATFWDKAAEKYSRSQIKDMAGYERTLDRAAGLLRPGDLVLELGCGTGSTALRLAPGTGPYLATDVSGEMVRIAKRKASEAGLRNLTVRQGASADLAASGARFDAVLAFNLLHLVRDLAATLDEIYAMLAPGGLFLSKTPCIGEMPAPIRWAIPPMQFLGKAPHVLFFDAAILRERIEDAGFVIEAVESHGSSAREIRPVIVARRPETG